MKKLIVFVLLVFFTLILFGQVQLKDKILTDIESRISLSGKQRKQIGTVVEKGINIIDLNRLIAPLLDEEQIKILFKDELTNQSREMVNVDLNCLKLCKIPTKDQQDKIQSMLDDYYINQQIILKKFTGTPDGTKRIFDLKNEHQSVLGDYLFIHNLKDAKYSQIFGYENILQLTGQQKESILKAYNERLDALSQRGKNGKYNSGDDKQINARYNQNLESILTAEQFDFYLEQICKSKATEMYDYAINELESYDLFENENRPKVEQKLFEYFLSVEKVNKRYEDDLKTRLDVKKELEENRPEILVRLKNAKRFKGQDKKYQGNFQW